MAVAVYQFNNNNEITLQNWEVLAALREKGRRKGVCVCGRGGEGGEGEETEKYKILNLPRRKVICSPDQSSPLTDWVVGKT